MSQKFFSKSTYMKALWLSIALHVLLVLILFIGDFSSPTKPKPTAVSPAAKPIQAVVVDKTKFEQAINKIKKQKVDDRAAENKRLAAIERRANEAKKRRANEEARIKKLEKQRKKKEQEKIKADKEAKTAQAKAAKAENLRKQKEQEKQEEEKAAAEARSNRIKEEAAAKKAEEAAKKAEALRKEKIAEQIRKDQEAKEQAKLDALLAEQMAAEMTTRNQARQQQVMSEIQRYSALITQSINRNMIKDRSTMTSKSCKLTISLAPSGNVQYVTAGTGDKIVCDAAKTAIYKAGTLPVSQDPEVFKEMRKIAVTVVPEF